MDELTLRPRRGLGVFGLLVFTPLFLLGLAIVFPGLWARLPFRWIALLFTESGEVPDYAIDTLGHPAYKVVGVLVSLVFGFFVLLSLSFLLSPGVRLTSKGFQRGRHFVRWADIEGFQATRTHLRVMFAAEAELSTGTKAKVALGKMGFYFAPVYISWTSGQGLETNMLDWFQRYHKS